jgi:hypothetical protein
MPVFELHFFHINILILYYGGDNNGSSEKEKEGVLESIFPDALG